MCSRARLQFLCLPLVLAARLARADDAPASPPPAYESHVTARPSPLSASATAIDSADFELRPRTAPNDVLAVVPGLLTSQHQGGAKADQLFLRGVDADHGSDVAVYVDGVPINIPSHAHGQGYADLHWIIPEAVARIDVQKGDYDVRHGDFATAGAVNLVTRDRFAASSVQYTLGLFPTVAGRAVAQGRFVAVVAPELRGWAAKLHPWLAFEAAYDDGPFIAAENLKRYSLLAKLSYDVTATLSIGIFVQAYGSGWIGSGQIPSRDVGRIGHFGSEDPSEGGQTERQMVTAFARYHHGSQQLDATVYVTRYRLSIFNDFTFWLNDPQHGDEIEQDDARVVSGARLSYQFRRRWGRLFLRTTFGVEARYDQAHVDMWRAESQNGDFRQRLGRFVDPTGLGGGADDDLDLLSLAGYVEEDVTVTRWLRVMAGLRADYFGYDVVDQGAPLGPGQPATNGSKQLSVLSPKATLALTPLPGQLELFVNFGEGFHTNKAQVALLDGKTFKTSDGASFVLRAIPRYYAGEIGARAHLWSRLEASLALWLSYLENETQFDADAAAFVPSAPTRRYGLDLDVRARLVRWLDADFDLAQATATAVPIGGEIALAPTLYMTGGLTAKWRGLRGGLRFRYLGPRPVFDEASPEYQYFTARRLRDGRPNPDYDPSRVTAQGWFVVDAYAAWRWRFLELALTIQNLLNTTWREAQLGNRSCTHDEVYNPANPNYAGSGNRLSDGTYVNRCGIGYAVDRAAGGMSTRSGVVDVHFTPGVPFNPQLTLKLFF
jgi:outer membrane receptor protein involved in Fe transport